MATQPQFILQIQIGGESYVLLSGNDGSPEVSIGEIATVQVGSVAYVGCLYDTGDDETVTYEAASVVRVSDGETFVPTIEDLDDDGADSDDDGAEDGESVEDEPESDESA